MAMIVDTRVQSMDNSYPGYDPFGGSSYEYRCGKLSADYFSSSSSIRSAAVTMGVIEAAKRILLVVGVLLPAFEFGVSPGLFTLALVSGVMNACSSEQKGRSKFSALENTVSEFAKLSGKEKLQFAAKELLPQVLLTALYALVVFRGSARVSSLVRSLGVFIVAHAFIDDIVQACMYRIEKQHDRQMYEFEQSLRNSN